MKGQKLHGRNFPKNFIFQYFASIIKMKRLISLMFSINENYKLIPHSLARILNEIIESDLWFCSPLILTFFIQVP